MVDDARSLLGPLGVWSMELRDAGRPETREAAAELDDLGLRSLWIPGLDGSGALDDLGHLLQAAPHSTVALGVLGIWGQDVEAVSEQVHTLDAKFGPRSIVGLGVSNEHAATSAGQAYGRPVASVGAYLDRLDQAAHPVPAERRLLGALGPKMADLAASRTAGLHPFLVTPGYSATTRERLGRHPVIAPHQAVVFESDPGRARAIARDSIGMFIGLPAYQRNLRRLGFNEGDVLRGGSDYLIDAVVACGTPDAIRARIQDHLDAGADHVAVHVLTANEESLPIAQWRELAALRPTLSA
jgi:probable F420-dependent oxidoreductase